MKKIIVSLLICVIAISATIAQNEKPQKGKLTFYTQTGDRFWLVVEGVSINKDPDYTVTTETDFPYGKAKIIFEDQALKPIDKTFKVTDIDEKICHVKYVIKKDKKGRYVISDWDATYLVIGGKIDGNPMNDWDNNITTTTTTTTTDLKIDETNIDGRDKNVISPPPTTGKKAMTDADFINAKNSISKKNFENDRLSLAKQIINANYFNTSQVVEIINLLSFENSRLDVAKTAYLRTIDKNNYFMVNDALKFSSSIDELEDYINSMK